MVWGFCDVTEKHNTKHNATATTNRLSSLQFVVKYTKVFGEYAEKRGVSKC